MGVSTELRRFRPYQCARPLIATAILGMCLAGHALGGFPWETRETRGKVPAHIEVGRMMTIAGQFERQKNYAKAAAIYRQVLAQNTGHLEAQKRLDFALAQIGESSNSPTMIARNQAHPIPTTIPETEAVEEVTAPQKPVVDRLIVKMPGGAMPAVTHPPALKPLPRIEARVTASPVAPHENSVAQNANREDETRVTPVPTETLMSEYPPRLTAEETAVEAEEPKFLSVRAVAQPHGIVPPLTRKLSLWRAAKPLPEETEVTEPDEKISSPFQAMLQEEENSDPAEEAESEEAGGIVRLSELPEESFPNKPGVIKTNTEGNEGTEEEATVAEPEAAHRSTWKARNPGQEVVVASARTSTTVVVTPLPTEAPHNRVEKKIVEKKEPTETGKPLMSSRLQETTEYRTGLIALCPRATQEIRRLIRSMETPSVRLRKGSLLRLCDAGPAAESALPAVREMLMDPDDSVRVMAARGLWKIRRETTGLQTLQDIAAKGNTEETCLAAYTLGEMGQSAREAIPVLERLCKARNGFVRLHAAEAVWKIKGNDEKSLSVMIDALNSEDIGERWVAAYVLSASGSKRLDLINALNQTLDDREPAVQSSAAFALGCLGKEASAATPRLVSLFESTSLDQHLRVTAYHALSNIEPLTAQKFTKISVQKPAAPPTLGQVRR
ncbi:MAG: HEAT repeat domain-containing protein [Planctomycetales bacterium]